MTTLLPHGVQLRLASRAFLVHDIIGRKNKLLSKREEGDLGAVGSS